MKEDGEMEVTDPEDTLCIDGREQTGQATGRKPFEVNEAHNKMGCFDFVKPGFHMIVEKSPYDR